MMGGILNEVAPSLRDRVKFVKVDSEKYPTVASKYQIGGAGPPEGGCAGAARQQHGCAAAGMVLSVCVAASARDALPSFAARSPPCLPSTPPSPAAFLPLQRCPRSSCSRAASPWTALRGW